jgi:hypothetical protein
MRTRPALCQIILGDYVAFSEYLNFTRNAYDMRKYIQFQTH